ncbi:hypothetical protein CON53_10785 [Bacillus cereus]|uniref:hypothetical protein n=1 Tax=Bacillus cereus group TaxID=86661 RepID=UPI000BEB38F1|nr:MULTISPECIES: hypothetical protein [Bacillus cereus group]PEE18085.1 hypothetical protein CON53_10785 [Bacillus cereus]PGP20062.1 hypothetical protein COA01_20290 [Bacillus cereus]PHB62636.1 hypothetical protein COE87_14005 [Bacillus wiedmannii]
MKRLDAIKAYFAKQEKRVVLVIPAFYTLGGQIRVQDFTYGDIVFKRNVVRDLTIQQAQDLKSRFDYMILIDEEDENKREELICQALRKNVPQPKETQEEEAAQQLETLLKE